MLTTSPSADNLLKASAGHKILTSQLFPPSTLLAQNGPKTLGQSLSMSSLLSVESDSSAPPPVAPPRSAQLNTGEVLQPYQPLHSTGHGGGMVVPATVPSQVHSIQHSPSRGPSR